MQWLRLKRLPVQATQTSGCHDVMTLVFPECCYGTLVIYRWFTSNMSYTITKYITICTSHILRILVVVWLLLMMVRRRCIICFFSICPISDGPTLWTGLEKTRRPSAQRSYVEVNFSALGERFDGCKGCQGIRVWQFKDFEEMFDFDFADSFVLWFWKWWNGMVCTLQVLESVDQSWIMTIVKKTSTPQWKDSYVLSSYELVWCFDLIGTWTATLQM